MSDIGEEAAEDPDPTRLLCGDDENPTDDPVIAVHKVIFWFNNRLIGN